MPEYIEYPMLTMVTEDGGVARVLAITDQVAVSKDSEILSTRMNAQSASLAIFVMALFWTRVLSYQLHVNEAYLPLLKKQDKRLRAFIESAGIPDSELVDYYLEWFIPF